MKPVRPCLSSNTRGVFGALTIVFAIATASLLAQFSTFDPSFEGELWGARRVITPANGGRPAGVAFSGGTMFVADSENRSLIAYDSAGQVVAVPGAQWNAADPLSPVFGLMPHQLVAATVRVNGASRAALLISDRDSNRVAAFRVTGEHLFTLRLQRPTASPTYSLSIGQMAMSPGARFNLATATSTLTLTGTFAAGWREQLMTGSVNSGALVYREGTATFALSGSEFTAASSAVLSGVEGNPVAPAAQNIFGVTFDTLGNLYALDAYTERLHVYGTDLSRLFTFGTPVADGSSAEFYEPWGLAFWPDASGTSGRLFINDTYNSRILIYRPLDGPDAGTVIDALQFESVIENFVAPEPPIELFSIALDTAAGTIAVTDFAELSEHPTPRVVVLQRPRLATFNFQVLNASDQVVDGVCTAAAYKVRFSLTVPAGLAAVNGVTPQLSINGASAGPPAGAASPTPLSAGQVATYTYTLTAPAQAGTDIAAVAGAAASNTTDILQRAEVIPLADCASETDPSTITATPSRPPQVSGWTPVFEHETFGVTLTAQDDDGINSIEYQLEGANYTSGRTIEAEFDGAVIGATVAVPLPYFGRTTLRYRVRDRHGIYSSWQTHDVRTKLVVDRLHNENNAVEFRVGDPEGVGYSYSVTGLPAGVTFSTQTGQFAGVVSFDAVQPYSNNPVVASGVYTVVVTETAPGGATSNVAFTWTINHINRAPIITTQPPAGLTILQGQPFSLQIDGFDPDDDPTVYTVRGLSPGGRELPPSITINRDTGLISGVFPFDSDTSYEILVGLAECGPLTNPPCAQTLPGSRLATLVGFSVAVLDANLPADVVNPGPQASAEGELVSLQMAASDAEGDVLTYTAGGLPPGLAIHPGTGLISGTLPFTAAGSYAVTVEVDDHVNTPRRAVTFAWTVTNLNRPPVVNTLPGRVDLEGSTIQPGVSVGPYAFDPDASPVTFVGAAGLPDGIAMSATGAFSGELDFTDAGIYAVTVTVSDGELTTTAAFTWTVFNYNRAPQLVVVNQTSREGDVISHQLPASDPDGEALFFSINGLPAGLTLNENTGVISGTIAPGSTGVYTVNVGVRDVVPELSQSIFRSFTWTVRVASRPPDVVNPGNQISNEGSTVLLQIIATDPDGDALTYFATGLPAGLSIDAAGRITGTLGYATSGSYTVTVRATDPGLSDAETFTWTVNNVNTAPVAQPDAAAVMQLDSVTLSVLANDSDAQGDALTVISVSTPSSGNAVINANGTITFTATSATFLGPSTFAYTVSDGTTTATAAVTITVIPNNAPPVCSAAIGGEIWPPNHKRFYVAPIGGVADPDGDPITITVTGIWQDEPIDSTGDGQFAPDGRIENGQAWLRGERSGHGNKATGNGRVYEILFTASDGRGGSCSGSVYWTVPHDQGQGSTAIDDGVRYDSTGSVAGARNKSQIHQQSPTP